MLKWNILARYWNHLEQNLAKLLPGAGLEGRGISFAIEGDKGEKNSGAAPGTTDRAANTSSYQILKLKLIRN